MQQFLSLLRDIRDNGTRKINRTGTDTIGVIGRQYRFDLRHGFPLSTTRPIYIRALIHENLFFIAGLTDNTILNANDVHIWDKWCIKEAEFDNDFDTRRLVYVEPRVLPYSDYYNPDSTIEGSFPNGTVEDKLRSSWFKMLSRCYDKTAHNYKWYGALGVFVCERWHVLTNFIEDVQKLPNWKHKVAAWNDYSLDKDYYSSNCYSPDTCLWLSKEENAIYAQATNVVRATAPDGKTTTYVSISECARRIGMSKSSLHRKVTGQEGEVRGNNVSFQGWQFEITDEPYRLAIPKVGELGPIYGAEWRNWRTRDGGHIDQLAWAVDQLRTNPFSRRIIISAWNPEDLPDDSKSPQQNAIEGKQCLAPCHTFFKLSVLPHPEGSEKTTRGVLTLHLFQRKLNCALAA